MGFLAPLLLVGLAAIAIPIAVHLLGRPQAMRRKFAAVDFLVKSMHEKAPRRRLREWLLLAARVLAVAAVAFALAKPFARVKSAVDVGSGAQSLVLVLDDSLSMSYRLGDSLFDRARRKALDIVQAAGPEAEIALVLGNPAREPPVSTLTTDHARIISAVRAAKATSLSFNLAGAIARARALLTQAHTTERAVLVLTDGTRVAWPSKLEDGPAVRLVDVSQGAALPNRAIVTVHADPWEEGGPRGAAVNVELANYAVTPATTRVALQVAEQALAAATVEIPTKGRAAKRFHVVLPATGISVGHVSLSSDALVADDTRFFTVEADRRIRVLVVNGDPRAVRHRDETFYLDAALRPAGESLFEVNTTLPEHLNEEVLKNVDVVILCNVKTLGNAAAVLRVYVEKGGGLWIAVGDNVEAERVNVELGSLLPRSLASPSSASLSAGAQPGRRIGRFDASHPLLAPFRGDDAAGLRLADFRRVYLLRPGSREGHRVLMEFDDGAPALVEAPLGRGRVLLFTSSIDRDWNDLPIRPAFLPLVQQIVRYTAGATLRPAEGPGLVGEPRTLSVSKRANRVRVLFPGGRKIDLKVTDGNALLTAADEVGVYRVQVDEGTGLAERGSMTFVMNVDPKESDLSKVGPREVAAAPASATPLRRAPLWGGIAAALLGLLLLETVLARRS